MKPQFIPPTASTPLRSTRLALSNGAASLRSGAAFVRNGAAFVACISLSAILSAHAADPEKRADKAAQSSATATASAQADTPAAPAAPADPAAAKGGAKQTTTIASPGAPKPNALPQLKLDNTPLPPNTPTYAPVVEKVSASVVTINTSQTAPTANGRRGEQSERNPLFDDPMIRRFFDCRTPTQRNLRNSRKDSLGPAAPTNSPMTATVLRANANKASRSDSVRE